MEDNNQQRTYEDDLIDSYLNIISLYEFSITYQYPFTYFYEYVPYEY